MSKKQCWVSKCVGSPDEVFGPLSPEIYDQNGDLVEPLVTPHYWYLPVRRGRVPFPSLNDADYARLLFLASAGSGGSSKIAEYMSKSAYDKLHANLRNLGVMDQYGNISYSVISSRRPNHMRYVKIYLDPLIHTFWASIGDRFRIAALGRLIRLSALTSQQVIYLCAGSDGAGGHARPATEDDLSSFWDVNKNTAQKYLRDLSNVRFYADGFYRPGLATWSTDDANYFAINPYFICPPSFDPY